MKSFSPPGFGSIMKVAFADNASEPVRAAIDKMYFNDLMINLASYWAAAIAKPIHFQGFIAITMATRKPLKASRLKSVKNIFVIATPILNRRSVCKQFRQERRRLGRRFSQAPIAQQLIWDSDDCRNSSHRA